MPLKIGQYTLIGHRGNRLEKVQEKLRTGKQHPVLKQRDKPSGRLPSLEFRRKAEQPQETAERAQEADTGPTLYKKWMPQQRVILSMDNQDEVIRRGALAQAVHRKVPPENRIYVNTMPYPDVRHNKRFGSQLGVGSLTQLTLADRLDKPPSINFFR